MKKRGQAKTKRGWHSKQHGQAGSAIAPPKFCSASLRKTSAVPGNVVLPLSGLPALRSARPDHTLRGKCEMASDEYSYPGPPCILRILRGVRDTNTRPSLGLGSPGLVQGTHGSDNAAAMGSRPAFPWNAAPGLRADNSHVTLRPPVPGGLGPGDKWTLRARRSRHSPARQGSCPFSSGALHSSGSTVCHFVKWQTLV